MVSVLCPLMLQMECEDQTEASKAFDEVSVLVEGGVMQRAMKSG